MYYEDVFRKLNEEKVEYVVVGGIALLLHGIVRLTVDLDLMINLKKENLLKFVSVLGHLGYKSKMPVNALDFVDPSKRKKWIEEKGMKVFSLHNPKKPFSVVDVFIDEPIDFDEIYKKRKIISVGKLRVPIVSVEHLIKLKKMSAREHDIADIKSLKNLLEIKSEKSESKVPFVLSKEKIRETYKLSPKMKLQWLEEANEFFAKVKKNDPKLKK